jgi:hypothetical protein
MLHQLHIVVEVDPALAEGMHADLLAKLARGIRVSTCYRGVRVDGLPGMTRHAAPIFTSSADAVLHLYRLADTQTEFADRIGTNATERYHRDRAAFLRLAAGELIRRRRQLWPAESVPVLIPVGEIDFDELPWADDGTHSSGAPAPGRFEFAYAIVVRALIETPALAQHLAATEAAELLACAPEWPRARALAFGDRSEPEALPQDVRRAWLRMRVQQLHDAVKAYEATPTPSDRSLILAHLTCGAELRKAKREAEKMLIEVNALYR